MRSRLWGVASIREGAWTQGWQGVSSGPGEESVTVRLSGKPAERTFKQGCKPKAGGQELRRVALHLDLGGAQLVPPRS